MNATRTPQRGIGEKRRGWKKPLSPNYGSRQITVSYISDTRYHEDLAAKYKADVTIINVVRLEPSDIDHLAIPDVATILKEMKPRLAILSHFGMTIIKAKPWLLAEKLTEETGVPVRAASDGLEIGLDETKLSGATIPSTLSGHTMPNRSGLGYVPGVHSCMCR